MRRRRPLPRRDRARGGRGRSRAVRARTAGCAVPAERSREMRRAWALLARVHLATPVSASLAGDVVARLPRRRGRARVIGVAVLTFTAAFLGGYTGLTPLPWRARPSSAPVRETRAGLVENPLARPITEPRSDSHGASRKDDDAEASPPSATPKRRRGDARPLPR